MTDTMTSSDQPPEEPAAPTEEPTTPSDGAPAAPADVLLVPGEEPKHGGAQGEIERVAKDYVIPISDEAMKEWAKAGPEEFKKYAEQVAMGLYPTFAPQIQQGIPTRVLLDPYIQVAQQVLGPVMSNPNWSDPKWSAALQGGIDPKTGRPIPMTLDEWRKHLMQSPGHGWEYSPQAHDRASQFNKIINDAFTQPGGM